jgi:hypothetical protein
MNKIDKSKLEYLKNVLTKADYEALKKFMEKMGDKKNV